MIRSWRAADHLERYEGSRALAPMLWAGGGFVAGVVFWHLIGFWSIVSMAVLGSGPQPAGAAAPVAARKAPAMLETGSLPVRNQGCVALILDRQSGETRSAPCRTGAFHHKNAGLGSKDDKSEATADWSTKFK